LEAVRTQRRISTSTAAPPSGTTVEMSLLWLMPMELLLPDILRRMQGPKRAPTLFGFYAIHCSFGYYFNVIYKKSTFNMLIGAQGRNAISTYLSLRLLR
jgi:hypothetical protein